MDYHIFELESPVKKDRFDDFSKEEVVVYFQWYTENICERIQHLQNYIDIDHPLIKLDFSVASLVSVWEWYEKKIKVEHYKKRELKKEAKKYPDWLREEILSDDTKIAINTLAVCDDLAVYFAEVLRRENADTIYWGYFTKPKNRMSVNEPVLLGFVKEIEMNPRRVLYHCTLQSIRKPDKNILFDLYHTWIKYVERR